MDLDLKRSTAGSLPFGFDWSCGPQLASQKGVIVLLGIGNLTKDVTLSALFVLNEMPSSLVPLRYRMTVLAASRCPFVALWLYFESMFVIVDISGRVDVLSHCKHPVSCCMRCVILFCCVVVYVACGILSTGYPALYGVGVVALMGPSSPTFWTSVSINASWLRCIHTSPFSYRWV